MADDDHNPDLGYLNMTISPASQYEIAKWSAHDNALENFCESDDRDVDAEYIDLSLNPERYTGYKEMRALAKAGPYFEHEEYYTGNHNEDEETRQAISNMLSVIYTFLNILMNPPCLIKEYKLLH
ncbi:ERO1-like protein alpha [Eumeta japonica]|uniref:ERO1-like protein alpha n=1 Tax=Eumeta variegata TaxID=151549 RepID=A0A4C2A9T7_EUMVA|nr:ERO1-like protein alpha [Eumeta japonica]